MNYWFLSFLLCSLLWKINSVSHPYSYEIVALHQCCHQGGNWTIHGMWPEHNNGSWPSYCQLGSLFNISEITPILSLLNSDWPDCYCSPDQTCVGLWTHEWSKHGTCSRFYPSQYDYFLQGLVRYNDLASRGWLEQCPNHGNINCYFYLDP